MTTTFAVTVSNPGSGNRYYIGGVLQATVNMVEGQTYRFDQSDSSNDGHPLRLSTTSDGTHAGGSSYTTGVTTAGTPGNSGAYTEITVAADAPNLFYYCTNHSGMGGAATTPVLFGGWGRGTWGSGTWGQELPVTVTGNALTSSVGSVNVAIVVNVTGNATTASVGSVTAAGGSAFTVTGNVATSAVGSVAESIDVDVTPSGNGLTAQVGSVTVIEGSGVIIVETGFGLTASVGSVNVWGEITPTQDADWGAIAPTQDASWIDIAA
mgnify:CR=1 FL=1